MLASSTLRIKLKLKKMSKYFFFFLEKLIFSIFPWKLNGTYIHLDFDSEPYKSLPIGIRKKI